MALILGIFDLLAYAIPGSLYLTTFAYVSHRAGWIDVPGLLGLPSLLLLIAVGPLESSLPVAEDATLTPVKAAGARERSLEELQSAIVPSPRWRSQAPPRFERRRSDR